MVMIYHQSYYTSVRPTYTAQAVLALIQLKVHFWSQFVFEVHYVYFSTRFTRAFIQTLSLIFRVKLF